MTNPEFFQLTPLTQREHQIVKSLGSGNWSILGHALNPAEVVIIKENHFRRVKRSQLSCAHLTQTKEK